jgi:hypothetical protein
MHTMRRAVPLTLAVVGILSLVGCTAAGGSGEPSGTGSSASPSFGVAPTGSAVTIDALKSIDGAERYEFVGFGIDVPAGWAATDQTLNDGSLQVQLHETEGARADVIVTVTDQKGADATIVDATSNLGEIQLTATGVASEIVRSPATWDGVDHAVAINFVMDVEDAGATEVKDGLVVFLNSPDKSKVVAISAEAPQGTMTSSEAYDALRTLRFDG